jgi:hypothetical protein
MRMPKSSRVWQALASVTHPAGFRTRRVLAAWPQHSILRNVLTPAYAKSRGQCNAIMTRPDATQLNPPLTNAKAIEDHGCIFLHEALIRKCESANGSRLELDIGSFRRRGFRLRMFGGPIPCS